LPRIRLNQRPRRLASTAASVIRSDGPTAGPHLPAVRNPG
jgi:hypothetical protein